MHTDCDKNTLTRPAAPLRVSRSTRKLGAAVALPAVAVLGVALLLSADPRGMGTHTQLGLPTCSVVSRTGYPCPSCGLTTSVTAAVHLDWLASLRAQPFGFVLAGALLVLGVAGTIQAISGRDLLGRLRFSVWWLAFALAGMFIGWGVKLALGVWSGTLPIH